VDPRSYLDRLGHGPPVPSTPSRDTIASLQAAHVRTVPFETLSVAGGPLGSRGAEPVALDRPSLFAKIVEDRRGGYCYELNGLFGWLLERCDVDVDHVAARILREDGEARPPANHLTNLVRIEGRRWLVDVGLGTPTLREPLPLDGSVVTDGAGVSWRVVGTERRDADGLTQFRRPGQTTWTDSYLFDTTPRGLDYFRATNDYLATAPESPFTDAPVVTRATNDGHIKLTPTRFVEWVDGEATEHLVVGETEWFERLEDAFDIDYEPAEGPPDGATYPRAQRSSRR
jgi:N-hydroxyarylamine O-acetyltransferase